MARSGTRAGGYICIDEDQGGYLQRAWPLRLLCRALVRWSMERHLLLAICADDPPISPTRGYMSQSEIECHRVRTGDI